VRTLRGLLRADEAYEAASEDADEVVR